MYRGEYRGHVYHHCTQREDGRCGGCHGDGLDCLYESLSVCKVCGALEGALLPECPEHDLTADEHDINYQHYCSGTGPFSA